MTQPYRNLPDGTGRDTVVGLHVRQLQLPTLTLRDRALRHNAELVQRWCREHGMSHAPHAKTHMSPELVQRQLDCGVWGITAASVSQARLLREMGATRVLIANQIADEPGLHWLGAALSEPAFTVMPLVDSTDLVHRMDVILAEHEPARRLPVLLELGIEGGRTGARSVSAALAVADAVERSRHLVLAGVECFEGLYPASRDPANLALVDQLLRRLVELAAALDEAGVFASQEEIVISAGGSVFFDRLAAAATRFPTLSRPIRAVIRAGGYLTHDQEPLGGASALGPAVKDPSGTLEPALELWAVVQSCPEANLAIVGFGKRDVSFDIAMPVVLGVRRGSSPEFPYGNLRVDRLNDQHAYLIGDAQLMVGDIVRLGVIHPCTSFDKWRLIPILDDDDRTIATVTTIF